MSYLKIDYRPLEELVPPLPITADYLDQESEYHIIRYVLPKKLDKNEEGGCKNA